jgi:hypothetical protein
MVTSNGLLAGITYNKGMEMLERLDGSISGPCRDIFLQAIEYYKEAHRIALKIEN